MIQSSVWQAAWSEGKAEGRVEGILAEQRALCLELIKLHHPGLSAKAAAAVQACSEPASLRTWILKATQLDTPAFARLLGIG